jgi:hypothetical protein
MNTALTIRVERKRLERLLKCSRPASFVLREARNG